MKKRLCVLLAALGGSVMLLGACSSVVDRFSRPESTAESRVTETSTEAELRAIQTPLVKVTTSSTV